MLLETMTGLAAFSTTSAMLIFGLCATGNAAAMLLTQAQKHDHSAALHSHPVHSSSVDRYGDILDID